MRKYVWLIAMVLCLSLAAGCAKDTGNMGTTQGMTSGTDGNATSGNGMQQNTTTDDALNNTSSKPDESGSNGAIEEIMTDIGQGIEDIKDGITDGLNNGTTDRTNSTDETKAMDKSGENLNENVNDVTRGRR